MYNLEEEIKKCPIRKRPNEYKIACLTIITMTIIGLIFKYLFMK